MPYDATTGVFARSANSFSNPVTGEVIDPTDADSLFDDYDLALNRAAIPTIVDKGTITSGTVTFSVAAVAKQRLTVGGALTVAFSNWPASGKYGEVEIELVNGGAFAVTWPTVKWMIGDGTNSTTFNDMGVVLQTTDTNFVSVWTTNGGATLYGKAI